MSQSIFSTLSHKIEDAVLVELDGIQTIERDDFWIVCDKIIQLIPSTTWSPDPLLQFIRKLDFNFYDCKVRIAPEFWYLIYTLFTYTKDPPPQYINLYKQHLILYYLAYFWDSLKTVLVNEKNLQRIRATEFLSRPLPVTQPSSQPRRLIEEYASQIYSKHHQKLRTHIIQHLLQPPKEGVIATQLLQFRLFQLRNPYVSKTIDTFHPIPNMTTAVAQTLINHFKQQYVFISIVAKKFVSYDFIREDWARKSYLPLLCIPISLVVKRQISHSVATNRIEEESGKVIQLLNTGNVDERLQEAFHYIHRQFILHDKLETTRNVFARQALHDAILFKKWTLEKQDASRRIYMSLKEHTRTTSYQFDVKYTPGQLFSYMEQLCTFIQVAKEDTSDETSELYGSNVRLLTKDGHPTQDPNDAYFTLLNRSKCTEYFSRILTNKQRYEYVCANQLFEYHIQNTPTFVKWTSYRENILSKQKLHDVEKRNDCFAIGHLRSSDRLFRIRRHHLKHDKDIQLVWYFQTYEQCTRFLQETPIPFNFFNYMTEWLQTHKSHLIRNMKWEWKGNEYILVCYS